MWVIFLEKTHSHLFYKKYIGANPPLEGDHNNSNLRTLHKVHNELHQGTAQCNKPKKDVYTVQIKSGIFQVV
jgi:hypothetical protein